MNPPEEKRPESPNIWPDPKKPGNRLRNTYILGGFDIDDGCIDIHFDEPYEAPCLSSDPPNPREPKETWFPLPQDLSGCAQGRGSQGFRRSP